MKKIILILLAVIACTLSYAETVKLNGLYYSLGSMTATLVKDQSSDQSTYKAYTSVNIPASVYYNNYTYPVVTIGTSAFESCSNLQSVTLPNSITTINQDAFYGCTKLGDINLPEGLTTIGLRAFYNCNLDTIIIPSTVTSISNKAFQGNATTSVVWKPVECSIGTDSDAPFYSTNSQITSFTFGPNVELVPSYICKNMSKLDTIVLPPSVYRLGQNAFMYCTSLKSINLPVTQKTLPVSFFEGCSSLESIELPATLTTINQDAFYGCSGLQEIHNYALTPQTITERAVYNINKHTCILYVPIDYIDLYRAKAVWCDFDNIIGVQTDLQFEDQIVNVTYLKPDSSLYYMEAQNWAVPHEPHIEGFTFIGWQVQQGMLEDGIVLVAVYQSNTPTDNPAEVVVNPANKAQKLIRQGNVYILQDDALFTITGQKVQ